MAALEGRSLEERTLAAFPVAGRLPGLLAHLAGALRLLANNLRCPVFWRAQAMVGLITLLHYLMLLLVYEHRPYDDLHHVVPTLYIFPIIYASLNYRTVGGVLTSIWCALLTVPAAIILRHDEPMEWLVELIQVSTSTTVALVISRLVDHEAAERRKAEEMSGRLTVLHQRVTRAQEEERGRIARELHDETAQSLVLLCRGLDSIASTRDLSKAAVQALRQLRSTAEDVMADVRRFSRDLRPAMLDDLGLVAAVEWLVAETRKRQDQGIDAQLEVVGKQQRLDPNMELMLFRIVQESLRNVEKHSGASRVTVHLSFEDERFHLSVCDNGKGFEVPRSSASLVADGRLGLVGMQERAQLVGGTFDLQTAPGKGTCINVRLNP